MRRSWSPFYLKCKMCGKKNPYINADVFVIIVRSMNFDLRFGEELGVASSSLKLKNDITAFTIAFWMKVTEVDSGDPGTPLSYAVEHQGYHPLLLHFLTNVLRYYNVLVLREIFVSRFKII